MSLKSLFHNYNIGDYGNDERQIIDIAFLRVSKKNVCVIPNNTQNASADADLGIFERSKIIHHHVHQQNLLI